MRLVEKFFIVIFILWHISTTSSSVSRLKKWKKSLFWGKNKELLVLFVSIWNLINLPEKTNILQCGPKSPTYLLISFTLSQSNDLALLKLDKSPIMNDNVGVACLPEAGDGPTPSTQCYISGWGNLYSNVPSDTFFPCSSQTPSGRSYKVGSGRS